MTECEATTEIIKHQARSVRPLCNYDKYDTFIGVVHFFDEFDLLSTEDNYYIAGGFLRRTISHDEKMFDSDIDLFFSNERILELMKTKLQQKEFVVVKDLEHVCEMHGKIYKQDVVVQLVKIQYGTPEEILKSFDFTISQFLFEPKSQEFYMNSRSLLDLGRKRLVLYKLTYPVSVMRRLIKYSGYGYYACQGCLNDIAVETRLINELDFAERRITYVD